MGQSDLDLLIEMGFERARAELAVKKAGGCQCFVPRRTALISQILTEMFSAAGLDMA